MGNYTLDVIRIVYYGGAIIFILGGRYSALVSATIKQSRKEGVVIMIFSFKCKDTEDLSNDKRVPSFQAFEKSARRKLMMLNAAPTLQSLYIPPGNRLEELKGNRSGQYSIRINDQWRICFRWVDGQPHDVEICDYH